MKKRPFAMMEVSVAIMLFILCLIPLVGVPFKILTRHKKMLNRMETYMRSHEAMFFLLKDFNKLHPDYYFEGKRDGIEHKHPLLLQKNESRPKVFNKVHYHLYHCNNSSKTPQQYFLYCDVCFDHLEDEKDLGKHRFFIKVERKEKTNGH